MDREAFDAWARKRFNLGDDVIEVKSGSDGDTACVWAIRPHPEEPYRRTFDRYAVPEVTTARQLLELFPVKGSEQDVPTLFGLV